jgi:uncharacterized protein
MNSTTAPTTRSTTNRIFIGPFGLRAGWSLLLYITLVVATVFVSHGIQHHVHVAHQQAAAEQHRLHPEIPLPPAPDPNAPDRLRPVTIVHVVLFTVLFLLSWLMAAIEHRRIAVFGLGGANPIRRFLTGSFWGFVALSLLVLVLHTLHLLAFDTRLLHGPAILAWSAGQLFFFFLVGLVEEYLFRGYLQFTLTRGFVGLGKKISSIHALTVAFWIAAIITSALFVVAHMGHDNEDKLGLFQVFLFGLLCLVALWRTGSLWWAIGFHMAWDWAQSFLYGVPNSGGFTQGRLFATHAMGNPMLSGGTVGPEGSVLCIPVLLLALVVLLYMHSPPQPPLEQSPKPAQ